MKIGIAVGALLAVAVTGEAHAASSGFRVEAQGGWDHVGAHLKYDDTVFDESFSGSGSKDGVTGGVEVGYDLESTGFVFGPEASILWSSAKYCTEVYGGDHGCMRMGREIEIGGRLGHRFTDSGTIGYLKIAYVNGRGRLTYSDGDPEDRLSLHDDRSGIRFGFGIEQPIGQRIYVKGEYRYTNFKNYKYDDGEQRASLGFDRHQVIGGVGVRF